MSTSPFSIDVVVSGQGRKLFEQLDGLTSQEAQELLEGGYFTALREAKKAGTLPSIGQLRDFIMGRRGLEIATDIHHWKIWKTIKLGTGIKDGTGFCTEIEKIGSRGSDWARDMLNQQALTVATEETEIDLVRLSVADLGFKEGACYDAICARAVELGLELCPAEVGPQLRLQYPDQPLGERLLVAMEAIRDSLGNLKVFYMGHDGLGQWLGGDYSSHDSLWCANSRFVFRLPRKKPLVA